MTQICLPQRKGLQECTRELGGQHQSTALGKTWGGSWLEEESSSRNPLLQLPPGWERGAVGAFRQGRDD